MGLETTELKSKSSDDFEANPTNANRKEELPPQTLRCPLPESTRVHPFCQENVVVRIFLESGYWKIFFL